MAISSKASVLGGNSAAPKRAPAVAPAPITKMTKNVANQATAAAATSRDLAARDYDRRKTGTMIKGSGKMKTGTISAAGKKTSNNSNLAKPKKGPVTSTNSGTFGMAGASASAGRKGK